MSCDNNFREVTGAKGNWAHVLRSFYLWPLDPAALGLWWCSTQYGDFSHKAGKQKERYWWFPHFFSVCFQWLEFCPLETISTLLIPLLHKFDTRLSTHKYLSNTLISVLINKICGMKILGKSTYKFNHLYCRYFSVIEHVVYHGMIPKSSPEILNQL